MPSLGSLWRTLQTRLGPVSPAPREARLLLAHVLGVDDQTLLKTEQTPFPPHKLPLLEALITRRLAGEPLAYVLGHAPFWGRDWAITPGVLIPRPDTETLVQAVLDVVPAHQPCRIAEVGVGSGAIVGSILLERPLATAVGTDISPTALRVAASNLEAAKVTSRCTLASTHLLDNVDGPLDVILSNPPYITEAEYAELDESVRHFEPPEALVAGPEGLDIYRALIPAAASKLAPHGWLMLEIGWQQAHAVHNLFSPTLWHPPTLRTDLAQRPRVVCGQKR